MSRFGRQEFDRLFDTNVETDSREYREPRCKFCGSEDVRWRQQGGRWVLFSLMPGVEHQCAARGKPNADGFGPVGDE